MAKNWKANELIEEIQNGNKDAIFDAGRRFPIFTTFAAKGNVEGLVEIIKALPDYITVRKIETILKENVQPIEDEEEEEQPKKKVTKAKAKKEVVEEEAEEEVELDEETLKAMKIAELRKVAKENKIDIEGLKGKKAVIDAILAGLNPDEEEDDDWDEDDDDDDDWDI